MPVYVLVDGMGPSDRLSFAVGDAEPGDLLGTTASVGFAEYIARTQEGGVRIEEDL